MANTTITPTFKGKNTCILSSYFMHFCITAIVEDVTANASAKLMMEKQTCWKPQFYMTVSLLCFQEIPPLSNCSVACD